VPLGTNTRDKTWGEAGYGWYSIEMEEGRASDPSDTRTHFALCNCEGCLWKSMTGKGYPTSVGLIEYLSEL
jgi:hypothetical protein